MRNSATIVVWNLHVDRPVLLLSSSPRSRAIHDVQKTNASPHRPIFRRNNKKTGLATFPAGTTNLVKLANSSQEQHMCILTFVSARRNEALSFYGFCLRLPVDRV